MGAFKDDLKKAGLYSIPLTLIILMLAFGALVAAGIPLLLGITAVLATFGLVALISQVLPMDDSVPAIILLIGLAVGVDYTMFYLKRSAKSVPPVEAKKPRSRPRCYVRPLGARLGLHGPGRDGRHVLHRRRAFASFAVATMTVVAVAMLGSLTVLPALLSKLGDGVDRVRCRSSTVSAVTTARAGSGEQLSIVCSGIRRSRPRWPVGS